MMQDEVGRKRVWVPIMQVGRAKDLGCYSNCDSKPLEHAEQMTGML